MALSTSSSSTPLSVASIVHRCWPQLAATVLVILVSVLASSSKTTTLATQDAASSHAYSNGNARSSPLLLPKKKDLWLPRSILQTPEWSKHMQWKDVTGCCQTLNNPKDKDTTCDDNDDNDNSNQKYTIPTLQRTTLGQMPQFTTQDTLHVLHSAVDAWNGGAGEWTLLPMKDRMFKIQRVLDELKKRREPMVQVLMWEIGKNRADAESEVDRTIQFAESVIDAIRSDASIYGDAPNWQTLGSTTRALVRRAAIGIVLCLGPYNYPINETFAMLLPALLMGNVCILKIPSVGGLAHLVAMQAFDKAQLPPGTMNYVAGPGASTTPPLLRSGKIDGLAFIGGSSVADQLIQDHPHPHRLKVFLQLEANNMAIYLPDLFVHKPKGSQQKEEALENALEQAVVGSLSYNGQRCTALKLHLVPTEYAKGFAEQLAAKVEALTVGLPWQTHGNNNNKYSAITPLPNAKRLDYMKELLDDAISKGARVLNAQGGTVLGGPDSTLMVPAVLYPVTSDMRVFDEEQFGPLVPIAPYGDISQVLQLARETVHAQQVSLFSTDPEYVAPLLDAFAAVFGKINLNAQCGRSPDTLPFSGRRSSALGVMSVTDALKEFSTPTVVSYKTTGQWNDALVQGLGTSTNFLQPVV